MFTHFRGWAIVLSDDRCLNDLFDIIVIVMNMSNAVSTL